MGIDAEHCCLDSFPCCIRLGRDDTTGKSPREVYAMGESSASTPARVAAVDAYRGLVMFLMMAEVLDLARVAKAVPGNAIWAFLAHHQTHAPWAGCSLHDL